MSKDSEKPNQDSLPLSESSSEPTNGPIAESKMRRKKPLTEEELKEYQEWMDSLPELPRRPRKKGETTAIFIKRKPSASNTDGE